MSRTLTEKWSKILNYEGAGLKKISEHKRELVAKLLQNQLADINKTKLAVKKMQESVGGAGLYTGNVSGYESILIPILRRIAPDLIAFDIFGTQPMERPSQLLFALRTHYAGELGADVSATLSYGMDANNNSVSQVILIADADKVPFWSHNSSGTVPADGYAATPCYLYKIDVPASVSTVAATLAITKVGLVQYVEDGQTVLASLALTAGTVSGTIYPTTLLMTSNLGALTTAAVSSTQCAYATKIFNNETMYNAIFRGYSGAYTTAATEAMKKHNALTVSVAKTTVEAKERILRAQYSFEVAEDMKAYHNLEAENELLNALSYEILAELNREAAKFVYDGAKDARNVQYAWDMASASGTWIGEKTRTLYNAINKIAADIQISTRRGVGNFIICSLPVKVALQSLDGYNFWTDVNTDFDTQGAVAYAGKLGGQFNVYVDTFATDDFVTVGYKGKSEFDAGAFYCPYVPLNVIRATGQDDFQTRIAFRTRYGLQYHPFGGHLYYKNLSVSGLSAVWNS